MDGDVRLPIKIVLRREEDIRKPEHGGGSAKVFDEVTPEVRDALDYQVGEVLHFFADVFRDAPGLPAVARIVLKPKALAKSHRPADLFNKVTCPIIGAGDLGTLYVRAQPRGLRSLSQQLQQLTTKVGVANISTIQEIKPFTATDAMGPNSDQLARRIRKRRRSLKLRLFRHHDARLDDTVYQAFIKKVRDLNLPQPESVYYASGLQIFRVRGADDQRDAIDSLAKFVGTQSLSTFPAYRIHRTAARALGPLDASDFPPPVPGTTYPLVGIVDTGIDPTNTYLAPWVVAREENVPAGLRDHEHGTFVAGLVVHARRLNQHPKFPDVSSRIIDVQVMPADGTMTEDELLTVLEDVLSKYPEAKVWNLSLSREEPCVDHGFSDFAAALDRLQDQHGVTFVVAAGNYNQPPLRGWPTDVVGEADRVAPPADSVRAIAVGSLAHLERPNTKVRREQPSPFSRRGPGPAFIPKPEVVHYGGNCDANGNFFQTGVMSTTQSGQRAENVGTSFSTPMVATLLANVESALLTPGSRNLTKALLVHSAVFGSQPIRAEELRYRGFGIPGDLVNVLTCSPWAATLIFETSLVPGLEFERLHFPIPDCLRGPGGVVRGEILMTAVYEPPLDPDYGAEYCRANLDISLGTYDLNKDGERQHRKQVPPEPKDVNLLYERALVENGFKWSPVKVYRRHMKRGIQGQDWRLKVTVSHRSGFSSDVPQDFALVVTIRDPGQTQPVYDEVVARMQQLGWITQDLQIHERIRERA